MFRAHFYNVKTDQYFINRIVCFAKFYTCVTRIVNKILIIIDISCFQFHGLLPVAVCVVPPEEGDIAVPDIEDAVVADRDPVGIPAEVLKDAPGAIEGRFTIDHPLPVVEMPPEACEVSRLPETADTLREYKVARCEAVLEEVEELASEQF